MSAPIPIPHADLIRAVLDGKVVQFREQDGDEWDRYLTEGTIRNIIDHPEWQWRVKPESVVWFMGITLPHKTVTPYAADRQDILRFSNGAMKIAKVLRLELDPDTLDVINARTEAP